MSKALSFLNPWAVWLIPLLLLLLGLVLVEMRRREAFLKAFGELPLVSRFSSLGPEWSRRLRPLLLSLAFLGVAAALARPVLAPKSGKDDRKPMDIVVVLDVSRSMGALDYSPGISRLAKAKEMILETFPDLSRSRVGIVTFAGGPFRQAPLTNDRVALRYILTNWVTIESAPPGGSESAQGIRAGAQLFGSRQGDRVLLLFSDGGQARSEDLRSALEEARSNGLRIFAFGLGSSTASRIPQYDSNGKFSGWLTVNGDVATTRLDEGVLKEIAAGANGAYSRVISGRELRQTLDRLKILRAQSPAEARELFQWPLAAALILLFLERVGVGLRGWDATSRGERNGPRLPVIAGNLLR